MNLLIEWKNTGYQEIMTFGILGEGENALDKPNDDRIFYWLDQKEANAIGADYDGGDWFVVRCACDECQQEAIEKEEVIL